MLLVGFFPFMTVFAQSNIHRCPRTFEMPEDKMFALWVLLQKGWIFPRSWVSLPASCGYSRYAGVPHILQVTHFWAVESESRSFLPIMAALIARGKQSQSNLESWQLCSVSICYKSSIFHLIWAQRSAEATSPGSQSQTGSALQKNLSKYELDGLKLGVTTL